MRKETKSSNEKEMRKKKKVKLPEYQKTLMNTEMINYKVYYMSFSEKLLYATLSFIVGGIVGYVFFGNLALDEDGRKTMLTMILNIFIVCIVGGVAVRFFLPMRTEQLRAKRERILRNQFRELLESLVTSLNSGKNITGAFQAAESDLKLQYASDDHIIQELNVINSGILHNINLEQLILDFGKRSGIQDIIDFAITFETCYRKGSNIKVVMLRTYDLLSNKMQMEEEVKTKISASTNEQYIMLVLPVIITAFIKMMSTEMADNYASPSGIVITIISIAIFFAAYKVGIKISKIEI